jgi:hypothetical protein
MTELVPAFGLHSSARPGVRAYALLRAHQPAAAIDLLDALPPGPFNDSLLSVARGMQCDSSGDTTGAARHYQRACEISVPLSVVLERCASHRAAVAGPAAAFRWHAMLDQLRPGAFRSYWRGLPWAMRVRLFPLAMLDAQDTSALLAAGCGHAAAIGLLKELHLDVPRSLPGAMAAGGESHLHECPITATVMHLELALAAKAAGRQQRYESELRRADRYGAPVPAYLREVAAHCTARGDDERAFRALALLDAVEGGAFMQRWLNSPDAVRAREAPMMVRHFLKEVRPRVYALRILKSAMLESFGEDCVAIFMAEALGLGDDWRTREVPLAMLAEPAARTGREVLVPPREVELPSPERFGEATPPTICGRSREVFLEVMSDMLVSSKTNLFGAKHFAFMDATQEELARIPVWQLNNLPVVNEACDSVTLLEIFPPGGCRRFARAFKMTGMQTSNFGHWTMEYMFTLWLCMADPRFAGLTVLVDERMPAQHFEALEFFLGDSNEVQRVRTGETVHVDELWVCNKWLFWPGGERLPVLPGAQEQIELADTRAMADVVLALQERLESVEDPARPRKLFLCRRSNRSRAFANPPDVHRVLEEEGYAAVDFNEIGYVEQLRYLRAAQSIVLEAGSTVFGLVLCRPGTAIGYFPAYDPSELECVHGVMAHLGIRLTTLPCLEVAHEEHFVDLDRLLVFARSVHALASVQSVP